MSGETEKQVSGWTVDTLRVWTNDRFEAMEKLSITRKQSIDEQFKRVEEVGKLTQASSDKAVEKAETAMGARLTLLNEFRKQSEDQADKFVTKEEFNALRTKVEEIQRSVYIATGAAIVIGTLLSYVLRTIPIAAH